MYIVFLFKKKCDWYNTNTNTLKFAVNFILNVFKYFITSDNRYLQYMMTYTHSIISLKRLECQYIIELKIWQILSNTQELRPRKVSIGTNDNTNVHCT